MSIFSGLGGMLGKTKLGGTIGQMIPQQAAIGNPETAGGNTVVSPESATFLQGLQNAMNKGQMANAAPTPQVMATPQLGPSRVAQQNAQPSGRDTLTQLISSM